MDHLESTERFNDEWSSRFPDTAVPDVSYLTAGARRGRTKFVLEDELKKVNGTISKLKSELAQQEFLQSWIEKELDGLEQFRKKIAGMKGGDKNMAAEGVCTTSASQVPDTPGSNEDDVRQNNASTITNTGPSWVKTVQKAPLYETIEDFPIKPSSSYRSKSSNPPTQFPTGNGDPKQNKEVSELDVGGAMYTQVLRKSLRPKPEVKPKPASMRRSKKPDKVDISSSSDGNKVFTPPPPPPPPPPPTTTTDNDTSEQSPGIGNGTTNAIKPPNHMEDDPKKRIDLPEKSDGIYEKIEEFGDKVNPVYDNFSFENESTSGDRGNVENTFTTFQTPMMSHYEAINNTPNDSDDMYFSSDSMDEGPVFQEGRPIPKPVVKFREDIEVCSSAGSSIRSTDTTSLDSISVDFPDEAVPVDMRQLVVAGILESDGAYRECLETLRTYMRLLKASSTLSHPAMAMDDYDIIFYKIDELYDLSVTFYNELKSRLDEWTPGQQVGDLFLDSSHKLGIYGDYVNNYQIAMDTLDKCRQVNPEFENAVQNIPKASSKEKMVTIEGLLYKPLQRVTKMTLTLHDLMKHTPEDHHDYEVLAEALRISEEFLSHVNEKAKLKAKKRKKSSKSEKKGRRLLRDGYIVELPDHGNRKLRHVFLYSDVILCAKQKTVTGILSGPKEQYDCKWYIPLKDLFVQTHEDTGVVQSLPLTSEKELEALRARISEAKMAIRQELHPDNKKNKGVQRNVDKLRKRLSDLEGQMLLISPNLPLRLINRKGKTYTLLMSSDYERSDWREAIDKAQQSDKSSTSVSLTAYEIQTLTSKQKSRKSQNVNSVLIKDDEELMSGILSATVHSAKTFRKEAEYYCCIEVDSYGHFYRIAKTNSSTQTTEPDWHQEFELDVDGAQTLRILCYRQDAVSGDQLACKGAYEMRKLPKKEETVDIKLDPVEGSELSNPVQFSLSLSYDSHGRQTMKRLKSRRNGGVFGVAIARVARRQGMRVPNIVRICCAEIEKRGLSEMGIYRISGVSSDIQKIKKAFEMSAANVESLVADSDIHAVACVIKLYFRELPEPLFTNERYNNFVEGLALSDFHARERCMGSLLESLPEPNRTTVFHILKHLQRVAENHKENKMTLHNLATVFGPNLLRPSSNPIEESSSIQSSMLLEASCFTSAMSQVGVFLFYLEGRGQQVQESHDL